MAEQKKLKTKDKILSVAIRMYNESGINGVTSRHIAAEMGISYGNLDYHYHTKEDLVFAIYEKMRLEASQSYTMRKPNTSSLGHFHLMISELEEFQYRYRFFNLDVLEISRSFTGINKIIQETFILRKQQVSELFEEFQNDGYLVMQDDDTLERIQHTIRMVITFWLSQLEIITSYKFQQKGEMVKLVWTLVLPYLTEAGKEEYQRILESHASEMINKS